jgi:hypothetical protein
MVKTKERLDLRASSKRLGRFFSSSEASFAFFVCLLVLTFAYRIQLTVRLFSSPVRPFDFRQRLPHGGHPLSDDFDVI